MTNIRSFRTNSALSRVVSAAVLLLFTGDHLALGQSEQVLTPERVLSIAVLARDEWNSGLRPATILANGNRGYVLMLSVAGADTPTHSSLVTFSEDGSVVNVQPVSSNVRPILGVDKMGNLVLFRVDNSSTAAIEIHSAVDGTSIKESPVTGSSPSSMRIAEADITVSRTSNSPLAFSSTAIPPSAAGRQVDELSQKRHRAHQDHITALLDDKSKIDLNLSRPELILSDPKGNVLNDHVIGRAILDRYSSLRDSNQPAVSYPELYLPAISPRGNLFALVGGTKLSNGAIAVQIKPETADIGSVLRFVLPKVAQVTNPDNVEGYLVPGGIAITDNYIVLMDRGSGTLAMYKGQF